jgi:hypothetical protein
MIATFMTWAYGTITETKERCLIMGLKEDLDGQVRLIISSVTTGEFSVVGLKAVTVDADKLRKLPL